MQQRLASPCFPAWPLLLSLSSSSSSPHPILQRTRGPVWSGQAGPSLLRNSSSIPSSYFKSGFFVSRPVYPATN
ncbi:hypothetical protein BKA81DRAFT_352033 [Phyllosticta paracitricarpa]